MTARITSAYREGRGITEYRVAGDSKSEVEAAVEKLHRELSPSWSMFTPALRWGDHWVAHGELTILTGRRGSRLPQRITARV